VLGVSKQRQSWLKKSLGTKDLREANIRAKPVLMEFDRTLARAEALIAERPVRASLAPAEIARMAELHYARRCSRTTKRSGGTERDRKPFSRA
jgi:hypothetical protein